jgi:tetratricopeptide (TPR) repeat protein/predicted Ser/Thr protein kinase
MQDDDTTLPDRLERIVLTADAIEAQRQLALVKARLLDEAPAQLRIDRFVVLGPLGSGGMGIVYAAYDPQLDRKVAIKLVRSWGAAQRDEDRERLIREARALAKLSHPNVVPVYEVGLHDGNVFLAMEFVRGETLREHVRASSTPWRDAVRVYLQAAEGLAAAHEVGLVHRDFKPDNAIVGADGRVRVVDFGLARGEGVSDVITHGDEPTSDPQSPLTRTGSLVGTPAYMAPEQRLGLPVQPSGDQFGFCAALHEALAGTPPEQTPTGVTLALPTTLPLRLRRVLARGLQALPNDRYPSMRALVADLRATVDGSRRTRITIALASIVGVGAGIAAMSFASREQCPDPAPELAGAWDPERREALVAAADRVGELARLAADVTAAELDRRAQVWVAARRDACEALYVRRTDSQTLFDRRMRCLDRHRDAIASLADELEASDASAWQHAVEAAVDLPAIETCADVDTLAALTDEPAEAAALRTRIDRVHTLERLGRLKDADVLVQGIVDDALALGHRATEAEALRAKGALLAAQSRDAEASPVLADAAWRAEAGRADELAADVLAKLMAVEAERGEIAAAEALALRVRGALERIGDSPPVEIQVLRARYTLAIARSGLDEAEQHARACLEISTRTRGATSLDAGRDLNNLGLVQYERGDYAAARVSMTTALEIKQQWLGRLHPDVFLARTNLASVDEREGHPERAQAVLEAVIADADSSLAPNPVVAMALGNLANLHLQNNRPAEALPLAERSLAVIEDTVGERDARLISANIVLGLAYGGAQRTADERACYERAIAVAHRIDPEHPEKAYALNNLAQLDRAADDAAAARVKSAEALEIWLRKHAPDHPVTGQLTYSLALAEIEAAAYGEAEVHARRAIEVLARGGTVDAMSLAGAQFVLARALTRGAPQAGTEALAAAKAAAQGHAALGNVAEETEVVRWIATHQ